MFGFNKQSINAFREGRGRKLMRKLLSELIDSLGCCIPGKWGLCGRGRGVLISEELHVNRGLLEAKEVLRME